MTVTRQGGMTLRKPDEPLVLSYGQLRLWVLDQLLPGTPLQHAGHIAPAGTLDDAAFQRALQTIVDRHEVLRDLHVGGRRTDQVIVPDSHSSYR